MKEIFDANPLLNEVLAFEDGTCFENNQAGNCAAFDYSKKTGLKFELVKKEVEQEVKPKNKNK